MNFLDRIFALLLPSAPSASVKDAPVEAASAREVVRLNVPRSVMHALRRATRPTIALPEPLVLLHVRFASEFQRDTVVAVAARPFSVHAYVEGFAGANFATAWVVDAANAAIARNLGLFLVHAHGGTGIPRFSSVDQETNRNIMAALASGVVTAPYGAMVLSQTAATAVVARDGRLEQMRVVEVPDGLGGFEMTA